MIYVIIAAVIGFAAWQLLAFVRKAKAGSCSNGCNGCGSNGSCSIQASQFSGLEKK